MKDISIGIYHKDHQYGKRLMEYLNHQKDFPMTASFTSDEEMFFKQEQEGDFECLVLAEETDYHGDFPVCRIGANESMGGMYCQSAKAEPQPRLQEKRARGGSDGKSNDLGNGLSDGRSDEFENGDLVRAHGPAALPISARVAMRPLQPARAAAPSPWRTALDHGGVLRLLGHALLGAQGRRHPLGHDAPRRRGATAPRPPRSSLHALPHVSRRRRPGRAPLPAAARPAAGPHPPPSAPGLQGLLRLLSLHHQKQKVIMNETPIRAYSKQELAQTYFPDIAPRSAVNRLRAWIDRCQPLSQALHEAGYRKTSKWFTPHEVLLIVHYLGDP